MLAGLFAAEDFAAAKIQPFPFDHTKDFRYEIGVVEPCNDVRQRHRKSLPITFPHLNLNFSRLILWEV